jgi:DNA-binding YbaB/EbfC family protein
MDFRKMMQQAQEMQKNMMDMQKRLDALEIEGSAGNGMIKVVLWGNGSMRSLTLDPRLKDEETEIIEDMIVAAHHDAYTKVENEKRQAMERTMGNKAAAASGLQNLL